MERSNFTFYVFLLFCMCSLSTGQSRTTCLNDNFEQGTPQLLTKTCDDETVSFIVKDYTDDDGIPAPPGSKKYLTNTPGDSANCLKNDEFQSKDGTRLTFRILTYYTNSNVQPECFLNVNKKKDNAWVDSLNKKFNDKKEWEDMSVSITVEDELIIRLDCTAIKSDSILAIDYIKVEADDEEDCEIVAPTTTQAPETTSTPTSTTISITTNTPSTTLSTLPSTDDPTIPSTTIQSTVSTILPTTTIPSTTVLSTTSEETTTSISTDSTSMMTTTESNSIETSTDITEAPQEVLQTARVMSFIVITFIVLDFVFIVVISLYFISVSRMYQSTIYENESVISLPRLEMAGRQMSKNGHVVVQITGKKS